MVLHRGMLLKPASPVLKRSTLKTIFPSLLHFLNVQTLKVLKGFGNSVSVEDLGRELKKVIFVTELQADECCHCEMCACVGLKEHAVPAYGTGPSLFTRESSG